MPLADDDLLTLLAIRPDSLPALSGIRIAVGTAIPAVSVTGKAIRMSSIRRTHCKRGHELTADNIYEDPKGERFCRMCKRILSHQWKVNRAASEGRVLKLPAALRTHCPQGHAYSGENLVIKYDGARACRQCMRAAGVRSRKEGRLSPVTIRRVLEGLHEGKTVNNLRGKLGSTYVGSRVVDHTKLKNFCMRNKALGQRILRLAAANRKIALVSANRSRRVFAHRSVLANDGLDAFSLIQSATAHLADFLRDEVRSMMFLEAAEGRLDPRSAAMRVKEFVAAYNRQFSKYVPNGGGIMQSLDQQVYDDGPTRLVDTVTRGLWD